MTPKKDLDHMAFLERCGFNQDQVSFICEQRRMFLALIEQCEQDDIPLDLDGYERDMWYTMNRSGLFEEKQWGVMETRCFITEWRWS